MAYRPLNMNLLSKINAVATARGIDWKVERIQRGSVIWSRAFVRNGSGDENNAYCQINIDDIANVIYVSIDINAAEKYQYLRDKVESNDGIAQIPLSEMPWKPNPNVVQYKLSNKFKFVNNGDIDRWLDEIFIHVSDVLKVVSNIVY